MSPKITHYFENSAASTKRKKKIEPKEEKKTVEDNLFVLEHDHAYCTRLQATAALKQPKEAKKSENKGKKILTPAKHITVPALPKASITEKKINESRKRLNPSDTTNKSTPKQTLTDYFPVRRSFRKSRSKLLKEKKNDLEEAILSQREDGLMVETFTHKGRGVRATKHFRRGDFVVEYSGELIDVQEAKRREKIYSTDENTGCYMYYFTFNNKQYCVDATAETKRLGRLINHSRHGNLSTKTFVLDDVPRLILIAKLDIKPGEELLYDYGDRAKTSLMVCPWLAM